MGVTIVASEFSDETTKKLQEEADELTNKYNYSEYAIMHHFALKGFVVSIVSANGRKIMNLISKCK